MAGAETALAYYEEKNDNAAEAVANNVLDNDPSTSAAAIAHSVLGNMYAVRNDKASAAQAAIQFQQVVKLEPDNFITWVNLGNAYMTLGKNAFAAEAYQQALNASQSSLEQGPYGGSTGNPGENGGVWQAGDPCQTLIMYINNAIALRNSPF